MHSNYNSLIKTFDPQILSWILTNTLDRSSIVNLCNACGVRYPGMRTKSVSSDMLVAELVIEFREQASTGDLVLKALAEVATEEIEELHRIEEAEIKAWSIACMEMPPDQFCRYLTAIVLDERSAAVESISVMIEIAQMQIKAPTPVPLAPETPTSGPASDNGEIRVKRLQEELDKTIEAAARQKNQNAHLKNRAGSLQQRIRGLQAEDDSVRRAKRNHETTPAEKDLEIGRQLEKQGEMQDYEVRVDRLQQENRKLKHELEQRNQVQAETDLNPVLQTFARNIFDIRETVESTVNSVRSETEKLRGTIGELQKEVQMLRKETQKTQVEGHKTSPDLNRVGIFVDVQNMFYAARQYGARLDFEKLMQAAVGDRRLIRAIAYVIQTPEVDQSGFVAMLQQRSYQVKRKDLRQRSDGSAKGDWDMGMAIDVIGMADKLDVVVLVSGDGDFVSLISLVKEMGPRVEVFSFPHNTARDLIESADRHYPIDESLLIKMDRPTSAEPVPCRVAVPQPGAVNSET